MTDEAFDFRERTVLVTGVGRVGQIGHAVATAFGRSGARLVLADVNAVGVAERAREFESQGIPARAAAGDLTDPDVARFAVALGVREFGRLDAVVNVAGGLTTYGPIARATPKDVDREIAINLKTTFAVSQAAIEPLAATHGAIVNISSVAYFQPTSQLAIYTAAKAAVAGFTRALAAELKDRGVRVNAVAPAMVRTPDNVKSAGTDAHYVELADLTASILYLASPKASALTGHVLPVTGFPV